MTDPNRFIDRFEVILLDMGKTFMFGCDRFDPTEDFGATYRKAGGSSLSDSNVRAAILAAFENLLHIGRDPANEMNFPSVLSVLRQMLLTRNLPAREQELLVQVFALHEVGEIPDSYAQTLRKLRETHGLGLVSNIWSPKGVFLAEFVRAGIHDLFQSIVFSSDQGIIKPAAGIFQKALERFSIDPHQAVMVGDGLHRDILGAARLGMGTVWINDGSRTNFEGMPTPDLTVRDLSEILE